MDSVTNSSVSKRKQACRSCRHRKKRCDARRPSCSLCIKWNLPCEYSDSAVGRRPRRSSWDAHIPNIPNFSSITVANWPEQDYESTTIPQISDLDPIFETTGTMLFDPIPATNQLPTAPPSNVPSLGSDITLPAGLPSQAILIELVEIFLHRHHETFLCFHRDTLLREARSGQLQSESPLLAFIICAIAARDHPDESVKALEQDWHDQATFNYEFMSKNSAPTLRILQAALCLVYRSSMIVEFHAAWLFIGKAWRQACALGLNRLDASRPGVFTVHADPVSMVEREEFRRTLWLLFILDRGHTWPPGCAHAIDDRQFKVNLPVNDAIFQAMSHETTGEDLSVRFSWDLNSLISSPTHTKGSSDLFQYLAIAYVLLGRIVEQVQCLHESPDNPEYLQQWDNLDAHLARFRLSLPREATSILSATPGARKHVVWLSVTLNLMAILLHWRKHPTPEATDEHFRYVVAAARNVVKLIQDASLISSDLLVNCQIGSHIFLAFCVLYTEWRTTNDPCYKTEFKLVTLVFERIGDYYPCLAKKFKFSVERSLAMSVEEVVQMRNAGFRGFFPISPDCARLMSSYS